MQTMLRVGKRFPATHYTSIISGERAVTPANAIALFTAMALLAALPGLSVVLVVTRSTTSGFAQGLATVAGIVAGDLILIATAIFGLVALTELMGEWFVLIRFAAGAWLLWLGWQLWHSASPAAGAGTSLEHTKWSSFTAGLLLTLSDHKAVLFYLAFLPAFVNLTMLTYADIAMLAAITIFAVGGVKAGYAFAAARAGDLLHHRTSRIINRLAALVMVLTAILVVLAAW